MVNNFQDGKIQVTPWSRPLPAKSKGEACDTVANPWTTVFWPERIKDDHDGEIRKVRTFDHPIDVSKSDCFDLITPELDHQGGSFAPS